MYERVNGRSYREFEISLPNELGREEQINLVKEFANREIGANHPYSFAIHEKKKDGIQNIHCHFMFTERKLDGIEREAEQFFKRGNRKNPSIGGTRKDETWKKRGKLLEIRKSWEVIVNEYLKRAGIDEKIDCRTLKKQREEALREGDLVRAEILDREPLNIEGKILSKPERALNSYERTLLENHKNLKILKNEKEMEYKKSKLEDLSKEELIARLEKNIKNARKENIEKVVLNSLTGGEYYKLLSQVRVNNRELKENPRNEYLKAKNKNLQEKIKGTREDKRNTDEFKKQYSVIEKSYMVQKLKYEKILLDRYSYVHSSGIENEKPNKNSVLESRYLKKRKKDLELKQIELKEILKNEESIRKEAVSYLTGHEIERIVYSSILNRKELKGVNNNLSVSKLMGKATKELESKRAKLTTEIESLDRRYSEIIKNFEKDENQKTISDKVKELRTIKESELVICEKYLSVKSEKINEFNEFLEIKTDVDNYKKLLKYYIVESTSNPTKEGDKKIYGLLKKLDSSEIYLKKRENEITNLDKKQLKELSSGVIKNCKLEVEKLDKRIDLYQKGKRNLESGSTQKSIESIALNVLSQGDYFKLEKERARVEERMISVEHESLKCGILDFSKKKLLSKEYEELKIEKNRVDLNLESLKQSIPKDKVTEKSQEIKLVLEKTTKKIGETLKEMERKKISEINKIVLSSEIIKDNFERYRPENGLNILKNIGYTSKKLSHAIDEQESHGKSSNKINLKEKEAKEELEI